MFPYLLLIIITVVSTTDVCSEKLAPLRNQTFIAYNILDDGTSYNYKFSICGDNFYCDHQKSSLCQMWDDNKGQSNLGRFLATNTSKYSGIIIQYGNYGDKIPGRGHRTYRMHIYCYELVQDIKLIAVNYAGFGTSYETIAISRHAC